MLSRRRLFKVPGLLIASALFCVAASAQPSKKGQKVAPEPPRPPTISVESDAQVVTICAQDQGDFPTRIRLRARASSPDGNPLRYRWSAGGGHIEGEGTDVIWDLTDARPGTYVARVDVESGPVGDPTCNAFTTVPVIVRNCPPPKPFCPNVSIYCPDTSAAGQPVTFTANVSGGTPNVTPQYNWTVSAGTISSGQGTTSITVDTAGLAGRPVTAKVDVLGYELQCSATCTTQLPEPPKARPFDEIGDVRFNDEKARLDNFAIQLQNEPGSVGYILVYPGRKSKPGDAQRRADRAKDYLVSTRGLSPTRVATVVGGQREQLTIQLWMVPAGAEPPRIQ
jgi:hypothetical protein